MWLLLLACTRPDLSGPVVAEYRIEHQGEASGRAWLHASPTAERTIWSPELAWDLSVSEDIGAPTPQGILALRQGQERTTHQGPLSELPLPERTLLQWHSLPTQTHGDWLLAHDPQGAALSDAQGLAMVIGDGLLILRSDLEEPPPLPTIRRAPIHSVPGQVGTLHLPPGPLAGHLAVAVDAAQVSEASADWLALQGVIVARSPKAIPLPLQALNPTCKPLVFEQGIPTWEALSQAELPPDCDIDLQR